MPRTERGLFELYQDDPERADALVWGRRAVEEEPCFGTLDGTYNAAVMVMLFDCGRDHRSTHEDRLDRGEHMAQLGYENNNV